VARRLKASSGGEAKRGREETETVMSKRRNRRHREFARSQPNIGPDAPSEVRQDLAGSSGAWSQEMSDHDTEEQLLEVTDDQIEEMVDD